MDKKIIIATLLLGGSVAFSLPAQTPECPCKLKPNESYLLYPKGQGVDEGIMEEKTVVLDKAAARKARSKTSVVRTPVTLGPGESNGYTVPEKMNSNGNIAFVGDSARIDIYIPEHPNGQMVVNCAGGGYSIVSSWNEGVYAANWLVSQGITACIVTYRLPNGHWEIPLRDMQNAFRWCRANAKRLGIDQIGVMGYSAGGHLAASVSTMYVDSLTRPDFSVLIYPVITLEKRDTHMGTRQYLLGKDAEWAEKAQNGDAYAEAVHYGLQARYSLQNNVTPDTPPTFIALSANDKTVPVSNSLMYFQKLVDNKVPCEMHIYPTGGHGWGFTTSEFGAGGRDGIGEYRSEFFTALSRFLKDVHEKK